MHAEISKIANNDNNNFAVSLFESAPNRRWLIWYPRYFASRATLPQENTLAQNNHLFQISHMGFKKMVHSYYCLVIIKTNKVPKNGFDFPSHYVR